MSTFLNSHPPTIPKLHVFEQAGGWHWGITVPRVKGCGFKVIAFSEETFPVEDAARTDGSQALASFAQNSAGNRSDADAASLRVSSGACKAWPRSAAFHWGTMRCRWVVPR